MRARTAAPSSFLTEGHILPSLSNCMRSRPIHRRWRFVIVVSILPFAGTTAQTYSVVEFQTFNQLHASAISASGLVAGTVFDSAFVSDGSTVTTIEPLLARMDNRTVGYGVND